MNAKSFLFFLACLCLVACSQEEDSVPQPTEPVQPLELYQLPVIFHVFYQDPHAVDEVGNPSQYIPATHLRSVLQRVNQFYAGRPLLPEGIPAVDMGVRFTLAASNEAGQPLSTPGVEYIQVPDIEMDCESFMQQKNQPYQAYLWDPNRYINVFLYHFPKGQADGETLGISHLPYTVKNQHPLDGLNEIAYEYLDKSSLTYLHCVSLNSRYAYEQTGEYYSAEDFAVTLAHELGHYLGLHHAFDEDNQGNLVSTCIDSDYCGDTPSYNREAYLLDLADLLQQSQGQELSLRTLVSRENCRTGQTFLSYNIMDYMFSYSDRFTQNQRSRMQHVLLYSPLLPTPRNAANRRNTRAVTDTVDLPLLIRK